MPKSIQFALVAMVFYGIMDIVYKKVAAKGIASYHFMVLQTIFFAPGILIYSYYTQSLQIGIPFYWGMSAGVLSLIALIHFGNSLQSGAVSTVVPIYRLSFVITSLLAVLILDENLSISKVIAFLLSICAIWLLLGRGSSENRISNVALKDVLIATILMGCVSLIYKLGTLAGGTPASVVTGQASLFFPLALAYAIYRDHGFKVPMKYYPYGMASGVLLLGALISLTSGLVIGPASTLVPIAQMSFVVSAAFGLLFLKEKFSLAKVFGVICAMLALGALAVSS
jgi:drug/metabolite transporter (DMT)-like permease